MSILGWLMTIISTVGVIANIYKKSWCFTLWALSNGFYCVFNIYHGLYSQAALFLVNWILAVIGLIKWTKDKRR